MDIVVPVGFLCGHLKSDSRVLGSVEGLFVFHDGQAIVTGPAEDAGFFDSDRGIVFLGQKFVVESDGG